MKPLFGFIERLSLSLRLLLGFSAGILFAIVIGVSTLSGLFSLERKMTAMYENDLLGISYIRDANLNLIYASRAMRHALIAPDLATRSASFADARKRLDIMFARLTEAEKRLQHEPLRQRFKVFQADLKQALKMLEHAFALIEKEPFQQTPSALLITDPNWAATILAVDNGFHEITAMKEEIAEQTLAAARQQNQASRWTVVVLLAFGVASIAVLGFIIGASVQRPNNRLRSSVESLARGETEVVIPHTDYHNEVGVMARAVSVLQNIYRQSEEHRWIKSQLADISSALHSADDLPEFAQTAVSKISPIINAGHAAFYLLDASGRYSLMGSYGYRERKHLNNCFAPGEGLVGQAALEKSPIFLTAPRDYIRINSGLGEGPPACIAVHPVIHSERVLGVLEVASFQQFSAKEKDLLEALKPTLATGLEILDRTLKTRELLKATRDQAERMEKQAAQLEEQQVEMEAQHAELLETENWFRAIIEASSVATVVTDGNGLVLLANPQAEILFQSPPHELASQNIRSYIPAWQPTQARLEHTDGSDAAGRKLLLDVSCAMLPARGNRGRCHCLFVHPA